MTSVLLGLRFLLELALLAATAVAVAGMFANPPSALLAAAASVVALAWGLLLSPRRRIDSPLWLRVSLELVLFTLAGAGLAATGHATWGVALLAAEVLVLTALALRGQAPGQDPGASR
jgi:hypothetical protein